MLKANSRLAVLSVKLQPFGHMSQMNDKTSALWDYWKAQTDK